VLIDGRQSECVLCCFPHHLLVIAETSKYEWTVKRSWKAKQVCTSYSLVLCYLFVYRCFSLDSESIIFSPHGIAMSEGLYFSALVFRSTRRSRPNKVGLSCPFARPYVRPFVRQSTKSFFDFNEIWYVGRERWMMHDVMQCDPIQGQGHEPLKESEIRPFSKAISSPIYNGGWQMTTDS